MPYLVQNNFEIYYQDTNGDKKPLVFIHGYLGSSSTHWGKQFSDEELLAKFRLVAPDLRGFGKSREGKLIETNSTDTHLNDLEELLIHELKLKRIILIGYSIGGTLALNYALSHPETIRGIILVCPRPFMAKKVRSWGMLSKEKRSGEQKSTFSKLLWVVVKRLQRIFSYMEVMIKKRFRSSKEFLNKLQNSNIPILFLYTKEDTVTPSIAFEVMFQKLPKTAQIIKFPGDHGISHENPELFKKYILDFSDGLEA